jgi:methionine-rich copper-binding protein CopC
MTRNVVITLALLGGIAMASDAEAHAFLKQASPPVGSTVPAPKAVDITFTEGVEPAFSSIVVQDANGQRVDTGDLHAGSADGLRLEVGLKLLTPGTYTVTWHATSVDTHKTEGHYVFTVRP